MSNNLNSFVYLQKPQVELDGKPCVVVGQSGLMALYDIFFSQFYNILNLIYDLHISNAQYTFLGDKYERKFISIHYTN